MATIATQRATQSANCYPNLMMKPQHPFDPKTIRLLSRTNHLMAAIEQPRIPHTIYESSWTKRPVRPDPSTGLEDMLRRGIMVTSMIILIEYQFGINTGRNNSRQHAATRPDTEGLHTPLCFTDEVLDHEFPEGLKPVNIEAYEEPRTWESG